MKTRLRIHRRRYRNRPATPAHASSRLGESACSADGKYVWIRARDPEVLVDVAAHFAGAGYFVRVGAKPDSLEVRHAGAPTAEQACREIERHLSLCQAMYPRRRIELVPEETPPA
jgi:hypothetical protein